MASPGPKVPDVHLEDMTEQDLRNLMAWMHAALSQALRDDQDEPIVEVLTEWYIEVFTAVAEASGRFRERFRIGAVTLPAGRFADRTRYLRIVEAASES